jgi:hypothetical protein
LLDQRKRIRSGTKISMVATVPEAQQGIMLQMSNPFGLLVCDPNRARLPDGIFSKPNIPIWVKILLYFMAFSVIWYFFPHFGILCQEKSGYPYTKDNY